MNKILRQFVLSLLLFSLLVACTSSGKVPVYPGAWEDDQSLFNTLNLWCAAAITRKITTSGEEIEIKETVYLSTDDAEPVIAWYAEQLPDWDQEVACLDVPIFSYPAGCNPDGVPCQQVIAIFADGNETRIFIEKPR